MNRLALLAAVLLAAPLLAAPRLKDRPADKANAPEKAKRAWFLPWITLTLEEQTVEALPPPRCVPFWAKAVFE